MKVWREGDRIRQEDGSGYGDVVPDETVRVHLSRHLDAVRLETERAAFCLAVLDLRGRERAAGGAG